LLENGKLRVQDVGQIKLKLHRPIEGNIKTVMVKRGAGTWYAVFSVECEAKPLEPSTDQTGIDVGLTAFTTLSDGTEIENPRYYKEAQASLRRAQRKEPAAREAVTTERKPFESCSALMSMYAISERISRTR
jgi:putative transposase